MDLPLRRAACSCGVLTVSVRGDPRLVGACHCEACQRRTGSAFGLAAFFEQTQVVETTGEPALYTRRAESGAELTFSFCANCGSTVHWTRNSQPGMIAIAVGAFADPDFPGPSRVVWAQSRHVWMEGFGDLPRFPRAPT
jgi:hypothetical protein